MSKMIAAFAALFVIFSFISAAIDYGSGGHAVTTLSSAVDEDAAIFAVASTTGYPTADYLVIGDEIVTYTGTTSTTFTGVDRGVLDTTRVAHSAGAQVFSPEAAVANAGLGFNVASTQGEAGRFDALQATGGFFTVSLPQIITWDYSFFTGPLIYLRYFFAAITIGFIFMLGILFLGTISRFLPWAR